MPRSPENDLSAVNDEIEKLLERKRVSLEKEKAPAIPLLNEFIEAELARLETIDVDFERNERDLLF